MYMGYKAKWKCDIDFFQNYLSEINAQFPALHCHVKQSEIGAENLVTRITKHFFIICSLHTLIFFCYKSYSK